MTTTKVDDTGLIWLVRFVNAAEAEKFITYMSGKDSMKADEVMDFLGISRQTLSNYVKRGLIKIDSNYTGKQYRYDRQSVIDLKESKRKNIKTI